MNNPKSSGLKDYKVMVLGVPGSGKTVYLASLFAKLMVQDNNDIGFFLKADDPEKEKRLVKTYNELVDPNQDWPPGTTIGEGNEWHFTCCVEANSTSQFEVLHFTYYDYSGELITEEQPENVSGSFKEMLEAADVFLGILDGQRVFEFMRKEQGWERLYNDLRFILPYMQKNTKPIHFIMMKWDLLDGHYSLHDILQELMQTKPFKNLVQQRVEHAPVRIMPVSSLGTGFAVLKDGIMQKTGSKSPEPFQVEIPLVCLLPDQLEARLDTLRQQADKMRAIHPPVTATERIYQALIGVSSVLNGVAYLVARLFIKKQYVDKTERQFFERTREVLRTRIEMKRKQASESLHKDIKDSLARVLNEQSALEYTINQFFALTDAFEATFPESKIQ